MLRALSPPKRGYLLYSLSQGPILQRRTESRALERNQTLKGAGLCLASCFATEIFNHEWMNVFRIVFKIFKVN